MLKYGKRIEIQRIPTSSHVKNYSHPVLRCVARVHIFLNIYYTYKSNPDTRQYI